MGKKNALKKFKRNLEAYPVEYAGRRTERGDWQIIQFTDKISVIIDEEGNVAHDVNHSVKIDSEYKYTEDYILLAGKLYERLGLKLKQVKAYKDNIKDIIYYDGTGLLEVRLNTQSIFIYNRRLIKSGIMSSFSIPRNYIVLRVSGENGVMKLETIKGTYYMSIKNNRIYSETTWYGKKLKRIFLTNVH